MAGKPKGTPRSESASAVRARRARAVAHTTKWREKNPDVVRAYNVVWRRTNSGVISRLLSAARGRARDANREFSITVADIFIPPLCPLLCIPIIVGRGKQGPNSPTVDRIDSSKGYVSGNVWIISQKANRIKSDATPEEIALLSRNLTLLRDMRGSN